MLRTWVSCYIRRDDIFGCPHYPATLWRLSISFLLSEMQEQLFLSEKADELFGHSSCSVWGILPGYCHTACGRSDIRQWIHMSLIHCHWLLSRGACC